MPASNEFFRSLRQPSIGLCLCWKIIRPGRADMLYTNHDRPLTYGSDTFAPTTSFSGTAVEGRGNLAVDNLSLTALTSDDISEEDLMNGSFDDSEIYIYLAQWDQPDAGLMTLKRGTLGEITARGGTFETEIRGLTERLQRTIGQTYTIECKAMFGDSKCKKDLTPFTHSAEVVVVNDLRNFGIGPLAAPPAINLQYGSCRFITGPNAGRALEIIGHVSKGTTATITLLEQLPYAPTLGDQVEVIDGCSKTLNACVFYNNVVNMRAFPHMPTEAEALETPRAK